MKLLRFQNKANVLLCLILLLLSTNKIFAQELNCTVFINTDQIRSSETEYFDQMKQTIWEFLNNQRWTNDVFSPEERIECSFFITIKEMPTLGTFSANMQIQSSRPIYNSDYKSAVFNFIDKDVDFNYLESQPLFFVENTFTDNLTSILSFYAYVVLGYDYDSFSEFGGSKYFEKANQIAMNAQTSSYKGWKAFDGDKNRYWLLQDIMNPQFEPLRKSVYQYHRFGLDQLIDKPDDTKKITMNMLAEMKKMFQIKPNSVLFRAFFESKAMEITNILSDAPMPEKQKAYQLLTELDPQNSDKYIQLMRGGR